MMCLTKPRLTYNGNYIWNIRFINKKRFKFFFVEIFKEDVLTDDKGECIICLEILEKGQTIARLPCLCIYNKQ